MNKYKFIILLFFFAGVLLISSFAFAATSSSYDVPTENVFIGGGDSTSGSYSLLNSFGLSSQISTESSTYLLNTGFVYANATSLAVLITSVTPSSGYNTGPINIRDITGAGFDTGSTVKLSLNGETIEATNVSAESSSKITCTFDLTGKTTGTWNLIVENSLGQTGTLPSAFEIKTWATLSQGVNYPNPFNPERESTTIVYKLSQDTATSLLIFNISYELVYRQDFGAGVNGGKAGDNSVIWRGINAFEEMSANGVYFLRVINRNSGAVLVKGKIAVSR
ncbi:hypothetical protein A2230_06780 [candidate division WOR-1 bacterium RIFOXYA2_FULL_36_21]|uniref:Uncharacterized protein n=1 Tax=candidate division WOR-1 bacterium RIFOXYB2_FULL_36_35 TaxID=1802578 RepID=A0A1F4S7R5_UNCSA|nr:MAG: hypothetical protein A2230_06780 [candidate division WOR-1 bacterium RIFOXYA2_FULL_36_21]OGC14727.1 MAG: hypothetical protein A2282_08590 [candidate division WOR-1 bacterium RIFOXYA12_FULL_36_13]OGC16478.1 MAG: hypothetical protein A2290_02990 [candidate division WOR-1 bacterium RIFOXYB2_FULL_36_35]